MREATSARVAHLLRERGFNAFIIVGGLAAWRKAGQPLELVPPEDLVKLPGVAETVDWAEALAQLGATDLDGGLARATLGLVLKHHDDIERARGPLLDALLAEGA